MKNEIKKILRNETDNYILPFLWMKGEDQITIQTEIQRIHECGIRAFCVEARPHPEFGKEGWWKDLGVAIEEAERLGMKIWILDDKHFPTGYANGLLSEKYPDRKKIYLNYEVCDTSGAGGEQTFNINQMKAPGLTFWDAVENINFEERAKNKVKKVLLVELGKGKLISETIIDVTSLVDKAGLLTMNIPAGSYRIMTVYTTRTDGGNEEYINLLDESSCHSQIEAVYAPHYEHFKEKFGITIMGFFSDEPQFGNEPLFPCDSIVGKEKMSIPWSDEAEKMIIDLLGAEWGTYLPFFWMDTEEMDKCQRLRYEYMNIASRLYQKNFSNLLGNWCSEHGVEYIGHVVEDNNAHSRLGMGAAHYFRAMDGQHMAGIDVIGGQIVFGAPEQIRHNMIDIDGEFFHYILGKLGASSAHLDPKKKGRLMCEVFGATGWRTGVREMRFILDHLLVRGVNYLVPHAFSMAQYPDPDCAPHFYARGNHPQFPYFKDLMMYANRMCELLNGGTHKASVAILYDAELEWSGTYTPMQKVARILVEHQIDFDIVATDMLLEVKKYNTDIVNGKLSINGVHFEALLIPEAEGIPIGLAKWIGNHPEVEVIFLENLPKKIVNLTEPKDAALLQEIIRNSEVIRMENLVYELRSKGYYDISLKEDYSMLTIYHYQKDQDVYLFLNESAVNVFRGTLCLQTERPLFAYDGLKNEITLLNTTVSEGRAEFELELLQGGSIAVIEADYEEFAKLCEYEPLSATLSHTEELIISEHWRVKTVRAIDYPEFIGEQKMDQLVPYSRVDGTFSGIISYEREVELVAVGILYFSVEHVNDVIHLWVNGIDFGRKIAPPFIYNITKAVKTGINQIRVEVATTLEREQVNYPATPFVFSFESMLPTGMYGKISLLRRKTVQERTL